jgi:homogentisate 1,2-dioxygenase
VQDFAHRPHPGAYEASVGSKRTDELAVMMDTFRPLVPTAQATALEDLGYHESWRTGASDETPAK